MDVTAPSAARKAIEQARSVAEVKGVRDKLETLRSYYKLSGASRDQLNETAEGKVRAEWKGGHLLRDIERSPGERTDAATSDHDGLRLSAYEQTLKDAGLPTTTARRWQVMSYLPAAGLEAYFAKARADQRIITSEEVFRLGKKSQPHTVTADLTDISGTYPVMVVDPPWQMQKIERDVRPNQAGFDYPTMSEEELAAFFRDKLLPATAPDCHAFIWTTQKFLPMALRLLEPLGLRYVLTMVWHKPGGFQPVGLPQYNCEFIVYARFGTPEFIDTTAFNCCFFAPRREHSRKPDEFYDLVRRVTAGPRVDVFSREKREGFDQYGNEVDRFAEAG